MFCKLVYSYQKIVSKHFKGRKYQGNFRTFVLIYDL